MSCSFIYFDMGNVLLSFSHDQMCKQMADVAGVPAEQVRAALFEGGTESIQWKLERGDLTLDDTYRHFCEQTGTRPDRGRLELAACDIFAPIEESVALIESLHAQGRRLGILSNTNPLDWGFVTDGRFPFLTERFEHHAVSFEIGAMKPERAIYDAAVRLAGVPAEEVFFADDKPENVAGALEAGLDAVVFRSAEQISDELRRRGVEPFAR